MPEGDSEQTEPAERLGCEVPIFAFSCYWDMVVPKVADGCRPDVTVLAAGGICRGSQIAAALALGAQSVWCGTIWLGTDERELTPLEKQMLFTRPRTMPCAV